MCLQSRPSHVAKAKATRLGQKTSTHQIHVPKQNRLHGTNNVLDLRGLHRGGQSESKSSLWEEPVTPQVAELAHQICMLIAEVRITRQRILLPILVVLHGAPARALMTNPAH